MIINASDQRMSSFINKYKKMQKIDRLGYIVLMSMALVIPFLTSNIYYFNVLVTISINAILATGLAIVVRSGRLSLAQATFGGIGGYTSGILVLQLDWNYWVALLSAGVIASIFGILLGLTSLRLRGFYFAIATFTFSQIAIVILNAWTPVTGGMSGMFGLPFPPSISMIDFSNPRSYYFLTLVVLLIVLFVYYLCSEGTRFGKGLSVLGQDETIASALGVHATQYRLLAFTISSFIGGIAGSLQAHFIQGISPSDIAPLVSVFIVVMVMAGGANTFIGPIIGAIILTSVPELLRASAQWSMVFYGIFLLAYVFFFQRGLLPLLRDTVEKLFCFKETTFMHKTIRPNKDTTENIDEKLKRESLVDILCVEQSKLKDEPETKNKSTLVFDSVSCAFNEIMVLNNIDWHAESGKINGLIGPNGAGKTTFFNVITGNTPLSSGKIMWQGEVVIPIPSRMAKLGVARTFQVPKVIDSYSVNELITVAAELKEKKTADKQYIEWILSILNLSNTKNILCAQLSHYQKRLVTLGMALAQRPKMLLLDEPLAGLDDTETQQLKFIINKIHYALGCTTILIEHKLSIVLEICSTLSVLDHGRIIAAGRPDKVASDENVIKAYLGT